ncbi:MAG: hypothetical protein ACLQVY_29245 [Limisphaerales bacterium]
MARNRVRALPAGILVAEYFFHFADFAAEPALCFFVRASFGDVRTIQRPADFSLRFAFDFTGFARCSIFGAFFHHKFLLS